MDGQYSTQLYKDSARLSIGIKNIMDEDPPSLGANVRPGYDNVMHNVLGRTVYMSLTQSFLEILKQNYKRAIIRPFLYFNLTKNSINKKNI